MFFRQFFEERLAQYAYLIGCQRTGEALIIDPMRDLERYFEVAASEGLKIVAATETHIHADYLSGVRQLAVKHGVEAYLSNEGGEGWEYTWPAADGLDVHWLKDGDHFHIGNIKIESRHTPGHTPEHLSFLITDEGGGADEPIGIVSGDFVFVGDLGRPDLLESAAGVEGAMAPSAKRLFKSAQAFMDFPDYMQVWPGHGAGSACGKALGAIPETTVGYEKRFSPALDFVKRGEDSFVDFILTGQPEPPLYFADMKRLNRDGPPVLEGMPQPSELDANGLTAALEDSGTVVFDTRLDRSEYMAGHIPGSVYAPLDKSFPTIVGSYADLDQRIVLLVDAEAVSEAIVALIRIGFDRVGEYVPLDRVRAHPDLKATESIGVEEMERRRLEAGAVVLDVRRLDEFEAGHVPGAVNIAHTRLRKRQSEVPTGREILVHCRSGARAAPAASLLERSGHKVTYVDDLFSNWTPAAGAGAV